MADSEQPVESGAEGEPVPITRYPNRRLYDRSRGRYVTLQEVADLVRGGRSVVVRDHKTGEDLTRSILTQIILEYHPERMNLLPVAFLNSLIRTNETVLGFLREYLQQSLTYLDLLRRPGAANPLLPTYWMRALLPGLGAPPAAEADPAALTRRIAELERRLNELQAEPGKTGPKGSGRGKAAGREE